MATILGRNAKVAESTTLGGSYTDLGKILSGSLSQSTDVADETNNDSAGFKEGKYADEQASLDVTAKYDEANAGQLAVINARDSKVVLFYRVRPQETGSAKQWRFQGLITDLTIDFSTGEVEELSLSIESTGTITEDTQ